MPVYIALRAGSADEAAARSEFGLAEADVKTMPLNGGADCLLVPLSAAAETQLAAQPHQRVLELQRANALLRAQIDDLQRKLSEVEGFKEDVFSTIKALKREVAELSADALQDA
jgi:hypothetical protein